MTIGQILLYLEMSAAKKALMNEIFLRPDLVGRPGTRLSSSGTGALNRPIQFYPPCIPVD